MKEHTFNYDWRLADGFPAEGVEHHGCKAFGTFVCGGGSSMGYKLAGLGMAFVAVNICFDFFT